jgi:hypothetical protein
VIQGYDWLDASGEEGVDHAVVEENAGRVDLQKRAFFNRNPIKSNTPSVRSA